MSLYLLLKIVLCFFGATVITLLWVGLYQKGWLLPLEDHQDHEPTSHLDRTN